MIHLTIGPVNLSIEGIEKEVLPENTLLFLSDNEHADLHYRIEMGGSVDSFPQHVLYRKHDLVVFRKHDELESRLLFLPDGQIPYAYYDETDETHFVIYFNPDLIGLLNSDTIFYSLLALERHLNKYNAYVYHCAYLDFKGNAYLFSGPSGIGKTTHTDIWCKVFPDDANVLNGDKCLLVEEQGDFYAVGWPICGSSGICFNEKRKVEAIVLLQQAPENHEVPERRIRQFKRILEQLTVNYWNTSFVNQAMSFAEKLSEKVTCCTYACNMNEEAAVILNHILEEKKHEEN